MVVAVMAAVVVVVVVVVAAVEDDAGAWLSGAGWSHPPQGPKRIGC